MDLEESDDEKMMTDLEVTVYNSWENPNSQLGSIEQANRDGVTAEASIMDHEAQNNLQLLEAPAEYDEAIEEAQRLRNKLRSNRKVPDDEESEAAKLDERGQFEEAVTVGSVFTLWKRHGHLDEDVLKNQMKQANKSTPST